MSQPSRPRDRGTVSGGRDLKLDRPVPLETRSLDGAGGGDISAAGRVHGGGDADERGPGHGRGVREHDCDASTRWRRSRRCPS